MKYGSQPHPAIVNANEARRAEREIERRDLFARAALTGMLSSSGVALRTDGVPTVGADVVAKAAYELADAMLAARGDK